MQHLRRQSALPMRGLHVEDSSVNWRWCCFRTVPFSSILLSLDLCHFPLLYFLFVWQYFPRVAPNVMAPPVVTATLQAAVINAASNIVAQAITAYRSQVGALLDD